jgi:hypothetical protein
MATTYKILGQSAPSATTNTTVYTVGAGKSAVISTISVCNRGATSSTYRIAISATGTPANSEYIVYDATVLANDTVFITIGPTMEATKNVVVYASSANLSFGIFGSEIS